MLFTPIKPMLLATGKEVKDDSDTIFDIKWDGWRTIIHKEGDRVEAFTREGNNITSKFPELIEVGQSIKEHTAIIDAEGVVLRNGISVFEDFAFRGSLSNKDKIEQAIKTHPATFIAFDILAIDNPVMKFPLFERKEMLSSIIKPSNSMIVTPSVEGYGTHVFQLTKDKNMEGIVGKRRDSVYKINHRSKDWLKYKHFKIADTVILGFSEQPFSLVVGTRLNNGKYKRLANIEFGFSREEKMAFRQIAKQLIIKNERNITWIEPVLNCKVQYLEKTKTGLLRIASFKGFCLEDNTEKQTS
ncbi:DNA ligase [Lysinibacillus sp. K60]|uniref:ATP-dependent DNA ligase n=1 Tax=Lysinibacillus sp. K60 TaxID=2720027 RepID=UPI002107BEA1|nr:DNA ligase [Lysinibacillus sp. K60]